MGRAGQRGCPALTECTGGSALGAPPVHGQQLPSLLQFEQILGSELAHLEGLGERLEAVSQVQLDTQALRSQLSDQKVGWRSCSGPPCALLVPSPGLGAGRCPPTEGRRRWAGGQRAPGGRVPGSGTWSPAELPCGTLLPVSCSCSLLRSCTTAGWRSGCWASRTHCCGPAPSPCSSACR